MNAKISTTTLLLLATGLFLSGCDDGHDGATPHSNPSSSEAQLTEDEQGKMITDANPIEEEISEDEILDSEEGSEEGHEHETPTADNPVTPEPFVPQEGMAPASPVAVPTGGNAVTPKDDIKLEPLN